MVRHQLNSKYSVVLTLEKHLQVVVLDLILPTEYEIVLDNKLNLFFLTWLIEIILVILLLLSLVLFHLKEIYFLYSSIQVIIKRFLQMFMSPITTLEMYILSQQSIDHLVEAMLGQMNGTIGMPVFMLQLPCMTPIT